MILEVMLKIVVYRVSAAVSHLEFHEPELLGFEPVCFYWVSLYIRFFAVFRGFSWVFAGFRGFPHVSTYESYVRT